MVPREHKNNAYAKFGGGGGNKQRALWYFPKWPIEKLSILSFQERIAVLG